MDYCPCCGKPLSSEGSQVCYNCLYDAKAERPEMLIDTICDLKVERARLKHKLFQIDYTLKELERAERRLKL